MRCVARALCVTPVWRPLARYSYPPFHEENHAVLYRKIRAADYTFNEEYWSMVSDEAKDLILKLLQRNAADRLSLDDVLKHPFIAPHIVQ